MTRPQHGRTRLQLLAVLLVGWLNGCSLSPDANTEAINPWFDRFMFLLAQHEEQPVRPLPQVVPVDHRFARLGKALFHSPDLSVDGRFSCASCHLLSQGGEDNRPHPISRKGLTQRPNTLSVLNSGFNSRLMWDGRARTLEEQARFPLTHPNEMGNPSVQAVVDRLNRIPRWRARFMDLFHGPLTEKRLLHALAEYQRTLITPDSPFDRFLLGEEDALSPLARRGWERFQALGCMTCHQGFNLGGQLMQQSGIFRPLTPHPHKQTLFRVPPLRNVAQTAPYFHDGSVATLDEAVRRMIEGQLGLKPNPDDVRALTAFLHATSAPLKEWPP